MKRDETKIEVWERESLPELKKIRDGLDRDFQRRNRLKP